MPSTEIIMVSATSELATALEKFRSDPKFDGYKPSKAAVCFTALRDYLTSQGFPPECGCPEPARKLGRPKLAR